VVNQPWGAAWDPTADAFAVTTDDGLTFVTAAGAVSTPPWADSEQTQGSDLYIAAIPGGVAEGGSGVTFVGPEVDVEPSDSTASAGPGPTEPPGATCEVLAGPGKSGPWSPVGGVSCYSDAYYPLATVAPPAGDTWFAVQARFGDWRSGVSAPAQWAGA